MVNNASAIDNSSTLELKAKKYALMHQINGRGTFWTTKLCLPHLLKSSNPHVLNLSPPLDLDPRWFKMGGVAYTMAKYNMSMCAVGMAEEFKGQVAFNCLWPRTAIATAAIKMLAGDLGTKASRSVDIMHRHRASNLAVPSRLRAFRRRLPPQPRARPSAAAGRTRRIGS